MRTGNLSMRYTSKSYKVLAISYGHEANASLMVDGKLLASAAEERFTKQKCQMNYPKHSINFCLSYVIWCYSLWLLIIVNVIGFVMIYLIFILVC